MGSRAWIKAVASSSNIEGSPTYSVFRRTIGLDSKFRGRKALSDDDTNSVTRLIELGILHNGMKAGIFKETYNIMIKDANPLHHLERKLLGKRKKEIKDALLEIGMRDSQLSDQVDVFFDKLHELFDTIPVEDSENLNIEFLTNKAQINTIANILEVIDSYKSKVDKLFQPISQFVDVINSFFVDSNKKLIVDSVGHLVIERPDGKKRTIDALSSGERQILVIFAHAFFSSKQNTNNIFIIDEPELSLHLRWQENFARMILDVKPSSQFIMATHSPEIIGNNKNKAIKCRKNDSPKK